MDLSLIPTVELLDTLLTRYDAIVIAGVLVGSSQAPTAGHRWP